MDEPLGALDKKLRDQMQLEIKQLHQRPRHHRPLRHARPGGGAGDVRPHLPHEGRARSSRSARRRSSTSGRARGSSPTSSASRTSSRGRVVASGAGRRRRGPGGVARAGAGRPGARARADASRRVIRPEQLRILQPGETADERRRGRCSPSRSSSAACTGIYVSTRDDLCSSLTQLSRRRRGGAAARHAHPRRLARRRHAGARRRMTAAIETRRGACRAAAVERRLGRAPGRSTRCCSCRRVLRLSGRADPVAQPDQPRPAS